METQEYREFQPGDIIMSRFGEAFYIYEGISTISQYGTYSRYSLLLHYTPSKYVNTGNGWDTVEYLDIAKPNKPIEMTLTSNKEDNTYKIAEEEDIKRVEATLLRLGYVWDAKEKTLTNTETGEIFKPAQLDYDYDGTIVNVKENAENRKQLVDFCVSKNNTQTSYYTGRNECQYPYGYDDDYLDY